MVVRLKRGGEFEGARWGFIGIKKAWFGEVQVVVVEIPGGG